MAVFVCAGCGSVVVANLFIVAFCGWICVGVVSTVAGSGTAGWADGVGSAAFFNSLTRISVDSNGAVFVADQSNHRIRKISSAGEDG